MYSGARALSAPQLHTRHDLQLLRFRARQARIQRAGTVTLKYRLVLESQGQSPAATIYVTTLS